jgi:hypothetical protein
VSAARFAYGQARVRARKSRLAGPGDAAAPEAARARAPDRAGRFAALVADYGVVLRGFPCGQELVRALAGLHEIENLKLGWRALSRGLPAARWVHLWRPLGRLETFPLADWRDAVSLSEALSRLGPPLGPVAAALHRSHHARPADVELALDRWASRRLLDEARSLPARERAASELVLAIVRERDLDLVRRGAAFGMAPAVAAGLAVLLGEEVGVEPLRALAAWTPGKGALAACLPPSLLRRAGGRPADWDDLAARLRRARRRACARAFRDAPFGLASPVAFLLLREEEERSWTSLAEAGAPAAAPGALERVLAAGPMAGG